MRVQMLVHSQNDNLQVLNRNRKLMISRTPTKAKSQEPAYSQALRNDMNSRVSIQDRSSIASDLQFTVLHLRSFIAKPDKSTFCNFRDNQYLCAALCCLHRRALCHWKIRHFVHNQTNLYCGFMQNQKKALHLVFGISPFSIL